MYAGSIQVLNDTYWVHRVELLCLVQAFTIFWWKFLKILSFVRNRFVKIHICAIGIWNKLLVLGLIFETD